MSRVLIVDDEQRLRSLLTRALAEQGHEAVTAAGALDAMTVLATEQVDLILLDLVMREGDGLTLLQHLRVREHPPIIVVSGVLDVPVRVQALNLGAVDVVGKPFVLAELMARVNRQLEDHVTRSTAAPSEPDERYVDVSGLRLDLHRRVIESDGQSCTLTQMESALLGHLASRRGDVCSREELLRDVWGMPFDPGSNLVDVCVRRLRAKLAPRRVIDTVRGTGYCLVE